jgi:hypothetical protein
VAPYNFWNMTKSWFRFNVLKRGFLLENKNCTTYIGRSSKIEKGSRKWCHSRCYSNNDVSIWPTFYLVTNFTWKKAGSPIFYFVKRFQLEKWMMWKCLKKFGRCKKYLLRKITFFNFIKNSDLQKFFKLFHIIHFSKWKRFTK